jgi:hypothetical protein
MGARAFNNGQAEMLPGSARSSSYVRALRTFLDARLSKATDDLPRRSPGFLLTTAATGVALVVVLHLLVSFGTAPHRGLALSVLALAPVVALAVSLIALMAWAYWSSRVTPTRVKPYVMAFLIFIVVGVCLKAFAGLNMLVWRHGVLVHGWSSRGPSLWATERLYAWHLANAIPLVSAPSTVGWKEPNLFADQLSGSLLLLFKLLVLAPTIHLAVSGYRVAENRRLERLRGEREPGKLTRFVARRSPDNVWATCALLAVLVAVGAIAVALLSSPTSFINDWLRGRMPHTVRLAHTRVDVRWVTHAPQVVSVLTIAVLVLVTVALIHGRGVAAARRVPDLVGAAAAFLLLVALLTELFAAASVVLIGTGAASVAPAVVASGQVGTAFTHYVWHMIDAVPGLALPETLNWRPEHRLVDHADGALLLAYKVAVVAILAVPVARTVRIGWQHVQAGRTETAELAAAREFAD